MRMIPPLYRPLRGTGYTYPTVVRAIAEIRNFQRYSTGRTCIVRALLRWASYAGCGSVVSVLWRWRRVGFVPPTATR